MTGLRRDGAAARGRRRRGRRRTRSRPCSPRTAAASGSRCRPPGSAGRPRRVAALDGVVVRLVPRRGRADRAGLLEPDVAAGAALLHVDPVRGRARASRRGRARRAARGRHPHPPDAGPARAGARRALADGARRAGRACTSPWPARPSPRALHDRAVAAGATGGPLLRRRGAVLRRLGSPGRCPAAVPRRGGRAARRRDLGAVAVPRRRLRTGRLRRRAADRRRRLRDRGGPRALGGVAACRGSGGWSSPAAATTR